MPDTGAERRHTAGCFDERRRRAGTGKAAKAAAREHAARLIDRAEARAAAEDRTIETAVETGGPAETIVEYVEDHDVDHVVMGGHGGERGDLARRLLGTVATKVVGEAPVTVTVVR